MRVRSDTTLPADADISVQMYSGSKGSISEGLDTLLLSPAADMTPTFSVTATRAQWLAIVTVVLGHFGIPATWENEADATCALCLNEVAHTTCDTCHRNICETCSDPTETGIICIECSYDQRTQGQEDAG